jgi:hypothetical protein
MIINDVALSLPTLNPLNSQSSYSVLVPNVVQPAVVNSPPLASFISS